VIASAKAPPPAARAALKKPVKETVGGDEWEAF